MAGIVLITDPAEGVVGDVSFKNGSMSLTEAKNSVILQVSQKLKFFYTEWFLDKTKGIPYIQRVYVKNPDAEYLDSLFKGVVLSVPYVTRITQWNLEIDSAIRILRLTFKADTTFGEIEFQNTLGK